MKKAKTTSAKNFIKNDLIQVEKLGSVLLVKDAIRLMKDFAEMHVGIAKEEIAEAALVECWRNGYRQSAHFVGVSSCNEYSIEKDGTHYKYSVNKDAIKASYKNGDII